MEEGKLKRVLGFLGENCDRLLLKDQRVYMFSSACVVSYVGFGLWGANFRDVFLSSIINDSFIDLL